MPGEREGSESSPGGLRAEEAARRLQIYGPNELPRQGRTPALRLFVAQFASPMVGLLFAAALLAAVLGEWVDALAITAILFLNGVIGFFQEAKAEKAVFSLREMTAPLATVVRDGVTQRIPASEVVPGDLLRIEAGDRVAADARLIQAHGLRTEEAPLTGESLPVDKSTEPTPEGTPLAERHDHVFLGTSVASGIGTAVVEATGLRTEMGKIATLLQSVETEPTPLQRRLAIVTRHLMFACLAIVAAVALLGLWYGQPWLQVLLTSVSLAVAAVPEGLPAVITVALALGVQRMAGRQVLVRRLSAVETLGSTTLICTDKTGTLTTGAMEVRRLVGPDEEALLYAAAACCDAELGDEAHAATGDTTELAILRAALARGIDKRRIEAENPRVLENPFDSDRKRMSVLRRDGRLYVKGAYEALRPISVEGVEALEAAGEEMAAEGLRVLAVAVGTGEEERDLRMLGLVGMADPPRAETPEALQRAKSAGMRTLMLTGDHPATARSIAREIGLLGPGDDPAELVRARVTAEEKLHVVREWKARGAVVAMTGDGVNDAPALREADVGIAMGQTGTEVTREAADLVLADDNYASIVAGVEEGRGIFENIRKTLVYLLAGNAGELLLMFTAAAAGMPLPLMPIQLLWINLVTDGLPALALVTDPPPPDVMERPPYERDAPMLGGAQWRMIVGIGILEASVTFGVFWWHLPSGEGVARTLAFTTLVFAEVLRAFAARHPTRVSFELGFFSNRFLATVVAVTFGLQLALLGWTATRAIFHLTPLAPEQVALCFGLGMIPVTVLEVSKLLRRWLRA